MDNVLPSKWAVYELFSLGYSVSSAEVYRFKQSVTINENTSEYLGILCDNVDHNTMTIDGKNSLHAMGLCYATSGVKGIH